MQSQDSTNRSLGHSFDPRATMSKPGGHAPEPPRQQHQAPRPVQGGHRNSGKMSYHAGPPGMDDDLDVMLKHEDFPKLLELAVQIQQQGHRIVNSTGRPYSTQQSLPKSTLSPHEILQATMGLQDQLLSNPGNVRATVYRGDFPITDAIMTDALNVLRRELDDMRRFPQTDGCTDSSLLTKEKPKQKASRQKGTKKKKEAIAVKYSKWQTDILMRWMIDHKEQPFPDQQAIESLMKQTGLSHSQVVNWTTNVRKRNRKATCQGGKKPHHFIDFLFLAHDREERQRKEQGGGKKKKAPKPRPMAHAKSFATGGRSEQAQPTLTASMYRPVQNTAGTDKHVCLPFAPEGVTSESYHPSMFDGGNNGDSCQPLNRDSEHMDDDELMKEFAETWLADHDTIELLDEVSTIDFGLEDEDISSSITATEEPALRPSVTDDSSHEDMSHQPCEPDPNKRVRTTSFDWDLGDDDTMETMELWAKQLDLSPL